MTFTTTTPAGVATPLCSRPAQAAVTAGDTYQASGGCISAAPGAGHCGVRHHHHGMHCPSKRGQGRGRGHGHRWGLHHHYQPAPSHGGAPAGCRSLHSPLVILGEGVPGEERFGHGRRHRHGRHGAPHHGRSAAVPATEEGKEEDGAMGPGFGMHHHRGGRRGHHSSIARRAVISGDAAGAEMSPEGSDALSMEAGDGMGGRRAHRHGHPGRFARRALLRGADAGPVAEETGPGWGVSVGPTPLPGPGMGVKQGGREHRHGHPGRFARRAVGEGGEGADGEQGKSSGGEEGQRGGPHRHWGRHGHGGHRRGGRGRGGGEDGVLEAGNAYERTKENDVVKE